MIDTLEQHFPTELAQRILQYHSHPTADIMRDLIEKHRPYERYCGCDLLEFIHYKRYNPRLIWPCKWSRKRYACGCRVCMHIRWAAFSQAN